MRLTCHLFILILVFSHSSFSTAAELRIPGSNFSLLAPDTFTELSEADIDLKWGSRNPNRPKWAIGTGRMGTTISYSVNPIDISAELISEVVEGMQKNMSRVVPGITWLNYGVQTINDKDWAYFEFTSYGLDQDIHNIMLIRASGEVMAILNFNSVTRDFLKYEEELRASIESLRVTGDQ